MDRQHQILKRLDILETKNLQLKVAVAILAVCVIALGWISSALSHTSWEEVRSNSFTLIDDQGKLWGAFGINDEGDASLVLLDEQGRPTHKVP